MLHAILEVALNVGVMVAPVTLYALGALIVFTVQALASKSRRRRVARRVLSNIMAHTEGP